MNFIRKIFSHFLLSNTDDKDSVRENIASVLDNKENTENISKQEQLMLRNVLKINEITARDIMIPRANISAVEASNTLDSVLEIFLEEAHSRAPVYEKNLDNIIGMVYKDTVLETMADDYFEKTMADIVEPVESVYETESVESVLNKFTKNRSHMFIVKDEFGGTTGIVTLEDCIETLLGVEIMDESDEVADMRKLAKDQQRQKKRSQDKGSS